MDLTNMTLEKLDGMECGLRFRRGTHTLEYYMSNQTIRDQWVNCFK